MSLKIIEEQEVKEIKCEVTLRTVNGEPADEITKVLVDFLPEDIESEEEETEEDIYSSIA